MRKYPSVVFYRLNISLEKLCIESCKKILWHYGCLFIRKLLLMQWRRNEKLSRKRYRTGAGSKRSSSAIIGAAYLSRPVEIVCWLFGIKAVSIPARRNEIHGLCIFLIGINWRRRSRKQTRWHNAWRQNSGRLGVAAAQINNGRRKAGWRWRWARKSISRRGPVSAACFSIEEKIRGLAGWRRRQLAGFFDARKPARNQPENRHANCSSPKTICPAGSCSMKRLMRSHATGVAIHQWRRGVALEAAKARRGVA